jgi:hypothetical protein
MRDISRDEEKALEKVDFIHRTHEKRKSEGKKMTMILRKKNARETRA